MQLVGLNRVDNVPEAGGYVNGPIMLNVSLIDSINNVKVKLDLKVEDISLKTSTVKIENIPPKSSFESPYKYDLEGVVSKGCTYAFNCPTKCLSCYVTIKPKK